MKLVDYFQTEIGVVRIAGDAVCFEPVLRYFTPRQARGLAQQLLLLADNVEHPGRIRVDESTPVKVEWGPFPASPRSMYAEPGPKPVQGGVDDGKMWVEMTFGPHVNPESVASVLRSSFNEAWVDRLVRELGTADTAESKTMEFRSVPTGDRFRYRGREFTKCQGGFAFTDNYIVSAFEPDAEVERGAVEGSGRGFVEQE